MALIDLSHVSLKDIQYSIQWCKPPPLKMSIALNGQSHFS